MYTSIKRNLWRRYRVNKRFLKTIIFLTFFSWLVIWILVYNFNLNPVAKLSHFLRRISGSSYLVNSTKCHIINLDPLNEDALKFYHAEKYEPCTNLPLLTYLTNTEDAVILNIKNDVASAYQSENVICCYSNITRMDSLEEPDNTITSTECKMFKNSITVNSDTISVRCYSKEERHIIYENTHATFMLNKDIRKKINREHSKRQISVLFIGIDSVSRLNFIRALPNTYNYVESNGWISLKGYNKVDDSVFPNLIAILSGRNGSDVTHDCNPVDIETFNQCPLLWNDYGELGYITSYAEDECQMSTFNRGKRGFAFPPTDFYFRPYMLASEHLRIRTEQRTTYCSGPEVYGERVLNLAKDFGVTFKEYPHFGVFWTNTLSHNQLNVVSRMDNKIKDFLESLQKEQVLENSVVIFLSDHGVKYGDIRLRETGWYEERLPFIYVSFPNWFKETFPTEYNNFKLNSERLTSPYDLHMTLQHLLILSGRNYEINQSLGCPTCKSLLEKIDVERSCREAGISQHWCTCSRYTQVELNKDEKNKVSAFVLKEIYRIIASHDDGWICARYFVNDVSVSRQSSHSKENYLLVRIETVPEAIFEATVGYKGDIADLNFSILGPISRLDQYFPSSSCVSNEELKKYCYCGQEVKQNKIF